jgi:hypothetical protein
MGNLDTTIGTALITTINVRRSKTVRERERERVVEVANHTNKPNTSITGLGNIETTFVRSTSRAFGSDEFTSKLGKLGLQHAHVMCCGLVLLCSGHLDVEPPVNK